MKKVFSILIVSALALGLSSCRSKSSNTNQSLDSKDQSDSSVSSLTETVEYTYEFNINGCYTKQTFTSLQGLCNGLEDNVLNNFCALGEREREFYRHCKGDRFKPFTIQNTTKKADSVSSNFIDFVNLKNDESKSDLMMMTDSRRSVNEVSFSCMEDDRAENALSNGIILLNNSQVSFYRGMSGGLIFLQDNKGQFKSSVLMNCKYEQGEVEADVFSETDIVKEQLRVGEKLSVKMMVLSKTKRKEVAESLHIYCTDKITPEKMKTTEGLLIASGSRILLKRDVDSSQYDNRENMLISCE